MQEKSLRGLAVAALPALLFTAACAFDGQREPLVRRMQSSAVSGLLKFVASAEQPDASSIVRSEPVRIVRSEEPARSDPTLRRPSRAAVPAVSPAAKARPVVALARAEAKAHAEAEVHTPVVLVKTKEKARTACPDAARTLELVVTSFAPVEEAITPDMRLQLPKFRRLPGGSALCPSPRSSTCGQAAPLR
jgi:hypothetical protein